MVVSVVGETPAVPESLRGFRVWEEAWSSRSRPGGEAHTHRPSRPGRRAPGSSIELIKQRGRRGTTTPQFPCKHEKWGMELATGQNSGLYQLYRNEARGVTAHDTCVPRAGATTRDETALEELWFPVPNLLQWSPGRSDHRL